MKFRRIERQIAGLRNYSIRTHRIVGLDQWLSTMVDQLATNSSRLTKFGVMKCDSEGVQMSTVKGTTFQVPRSLKIFGPKEQSRNYLGDLIHALRSHVPCTYLLKSDSLFCGETVPCLRNADRMCHMHGCHSRGRCEDPKCRYAWKLISHWYKCTNELCFICSPWVKPDLVDGQSRIFLNEIFGVEPLFKAFDFLFREYVFETSEPVVENPPVVSEDEKEDSKSTDFEIDIRPPTTCVSLGVQASFGALEVSKVPIQASCTVL